eukprot:scaffold434_cov186-Pinguiococcus_pyrenoidosus.AAC.27
MAPPDSPPLSSLSHLDVARLSPESRASVASSAVSPPLQSLALSDLPNMATSRQGVQILKQWRVFGGNLLQVTHDSLATKTPMRFSVFLPETSVQVRLRVENPVFSASNQPFLVRQRCQFCTTSAV